MNGQIDGWTKEGRNIFKIFHLRRRGVALVVIVVVDGVVDVVVVACFVYLVSWFA